MNYSLTKVKLKEFEGLYDLLLSSEEPLNPELIKNLENFSVIFAEDSDNNYNFVKFFINEFKEEIIANLNMEQQLVKINDCLFLIKGVVWAALILESE
jgi:hypothetical protein